MNSILLVGSIVRRGEINFRLAPLPVVAGDIEQTIDSLFAPVADEECADDGTLFAMIDAANDETNWYEARLEELRDGMEDEEWHARGGW